MGGLEIFATKIKELRESFGMTQKDFSQYVGIKQQTLSGYERGLMKPPLDIVTEIAQKCDVSIDWLCGLSVKMRNEDELKTYSDVIDTFVKLESILKFNVAPLSIKITDRVMQSFLRDWGKMLSLYRSGTIDNKLYKLWLDDKKKEYADIHLGNKDEIEGFLSVMIAIESTKDAPEE